MLNGEIGNTGRLSAENLDKLRKVFETRGLAPIGLSLRDFEGLSESLALAKVEAEGFAEKIAEIRMDTITAQSKRLQNNIANLGGEFFKGVMGAGDLVESFKELNDWLEKIRPNVQALGDSIGWLSYNINNSVSAWKMLFKELDKAPLWEKAFPPVHLFNALKKYAKAHEEAGLGLKDSVSYMEMILKEELAITEQRKADNILIEKTDSNTKKVLRDVKQVKEEETHIVNLMKAMEAHEVDIARYKLDSLEILKLQMTDEEYALELQKRQNDVLESQVKFREKIKDSISSAESDLLKTMGASELQILQHKRKQIEADRELIGEAQYLIDLTENRRQIQLAIAKETRNEKDTVTDLAFQYSKANDEEKKLLERFFELRKLDPSDLANKWKKNMFDKEVITKYWTAFSQEGRDAIADVIVDSSKINIERKRKGGIYPWETGKMEGEPIVPSIPADFERKMTQDIPKSFWDNWLTQEEIAVRKFAEDFNLMGTPEAGFKKPGYSPERESEKIKIQSKLAEFGITIPIENIEVNLPNDTLDRVSEATAKELEEKLKNNEDLAKKLAKIIRPYL